MKLSLIWNGLNAAAEEEQVRELLRLGSREGTSTILLTAEEARLLLAARRRSLAAYGRVELDIRPLKQLLRAFGGSPYLEKNSPGSTLPELLELFYYARNETEDRLSDDRLLELLRHWYDGVCQGSIELLRDRVELYAGKLRLELARREAEGEE
ncbi:DUF6323 family protein [Gorillibacterium sp. sgz500922]|uniref:DUF6323 family protein n=1 Tax=Gorillibacterium sp. sgz500922 TaxID=3446694 RepID=UPI003F66EE1C